MKWIWHETLTIYRFIGAAWPAEFFCHFLFLLNIWPLVCFIKVKYCAKLERIADKILSTARFQLEAMLPGTLSNYSGDMYLGWRYMLSIFCQVVILYNVGSTLKLRRIIAGMANPSQFRDWARRSVIVPKWQLAHSFYIWTLPPSISLIGHSFKEVGPLWPCQKQDKWAVAIHSNKEESNWKMTLGLFSTELYCAYLLNRRNKIANINFYISEHI